MASVNIKVNLITKAAELQLGKLGATARGTARDLTRAGASAKGFGKDFGTSFRQSSLAFGRFGTLLRAGLIGGTLFGIGAGIKKTIKDFREFEVALVGVGKTSNLSDRELQDFGVTIQKLGNIIPVPTNELLKLAQVAAQLGITGTKNLTKFAEVGARLGVATDLSSEQAVTALTRIINITGESADSIDLVGSALVNLGNNFNATESEILSVSNRIARSTAGFEISSDQIFAIGTALKSTGVQAQAGGTAVGTALTEISESLVGGGKQLEEFTRITGLTAEELQKSLVEDAGKTFKILIEGLNRSSKDGIELTSNLNKLQLGTKRVAAALRPLVSDVRLLDSTFRSSSEGIQDSSALLDESNKRFNTLDSSIQKLDTAFTTLFTNIGKNTPRLRSLIDLLTKGALAFNNFVNPTKNATQELVDLTVKLSEAESKLKDLKDQAETGVKTVRIGESGFSEDINQAIARQRKEVVQLGLEFGRLTARRNADIDKAKVAKETEGGESGDGPRVALQKEFDLRKFFIEANRELSTQATLEEKTAIALFNEEKYGILVAALGEEETAKTLARAAELEAEGKHAQALKLIAENQAKAEQKIAKEREVLDRKVASAKVNIIGNAGELINAIAGKQTKAGFLLSKAAAAGQILLADGQARAAATTAAAISSIAAPPGTNLAAFGATKGTYDGLITANTALSLGVVAAQAIKGFQEGGVVGGNSFTGDNVLARVNSGEMILNRQQQQQLFAQANGQSSGGGGGSNVINTTVEIDGEAVAKAVSRQVSNGVELGEFE